MKNKINNPPVLSLAREIQVLALVHKTILHACSSNCGYIGNNAEYVSSDEIVIVSRVRA